MNYIGNAFSLGMLDCLSDSDVNIHCHLLNDDQACEWVRENNPVSCVGHLDTANLFTNLLGREVVMNRISTSLVVGDTLLVGQYNGPRLPEGAVSLPEGARIRWILARVVG
jgi:hypothetical protein